MRKFVQSIALVALLGILLTACKKNSDGGSDYYFKMKVNGNWVTYDQAECELGPDLGDPSLMDFVVNGGNQNEIMSIAVQSSAAIVPGSYNTASVSTYTMLADYWKINGSDIQVFDHYGPGTGTDPLYTLNITSITETEIRGNFTGNYLYNSSEDETINITEGEFVALRID